MEIEWGFGTGQGWRRPPYKQKGDAALGSWSLVPGNKDSEASVLPSKEVFTEMGKFNEELVKAGVMLAGEGLYPTSRGMRIKFSREKRTITDRPFTESREVIAGFWLSQVRSMEEAIEWLKRAPFGGGVDIEIRPMFQDCDKESVSRV